VFAAEEGRDVALQRVLGHLVADEAPQRRLELSAFAIDRLEVSVADYGRCVRAGRCTPVPAASALGAFRLAAAPQVNVTWHQAAAYCAFQGGRLPTEAEWEKAARGPLGRLWPWGDRYHERAFNHGTIHPLRDAFHGSAADGWFYVAPRGSFPTDRSFYGALDLGGNAAEWVADWYQIGHWASATTDLRDPRGPSGGLGRLIKGGSWRRLRLLSRPAARRFLEPDQRAADVGFRCARSGG
jgi:formylglycine-generating enzyme required for sulfatase activity